MSHSIDPILFKKMNARKQAQTLTNLMLQGKNDEVQRLIKACRERSIEPVEAKKKVKIQMDKQHIIKSNVNAGRNLYTVDFCTSDEFRYNASPNSDSKRSNREVLGGSGSNMYRGRKR